MNLLYLISIISIANADLPSSGESAEKVRSMKASVYGTTADSTGACSPHADSKATAHTFLKIVDLPAMFGPAESNKGRFDCIKSQKRSLGPEDFDTDLGWHSVP